MINNNYNYQGKDYAMGGIINGEIDNMTITGGQESEIYEVSLDNGNFIRISPKYGLFVRIGGDTYSAFSVASLKVGDCIYNVNSDKQSCSPIISINKVVGKHIEIPKQSFLLNNIYVSTVFKERSPDIAQDAKNRDSCTHRSKEMIQHTITSCCSTHERHDYFCEAKKIYLTQPVCWNCDIYKTKE